MPTHVIDPLQAVYLAEGGGPTVAEEWLEAARERADRIGADARDLAAGYGSDLTYLTEIGRPGRVIVDVAEDRGVDHVVMGSHGRDGIPRLVLGSVSESILRNSPFPVTIVR